MTVEVVAHIANLAGTDELWTQDSPEWQALDRQLPADHPVRRILAAVDLIDLQPLLDSYLGVGRESHPELLLRLTLYELQQDRPSPAQWARDVCNSLPLKWLTFGMCPSRSTLYRFRDRIGAFLKEWNAQVLQHAFADDLTAADRAALDSSTIAAHASRRHLLNAQRVEERLAAISAALDGDSDAAARPGWLARTDRGLCEQKRRYKLAAEILELRRIANAQRRSDKRQPDDKIVISPGDPEAILARDKLDVFRPLYNAQVLRDLDTPLILSYGVCLQSNDNGMLQPIIEQLADDVGRKPATLLVDAGYVSMQHLEFCDTAGITLYGPVQSNDFTVDLGKKPQQNQHTSLPKSAFRWLDDKQAFKCPEGHLLTLRTTTHQRRADHSIELKLYTCAPEHCLKCPQQPSCTRAPQKGRTVSRMANEHLLDALRARMEPSETKKLYKQRSQTVELTFADLKEHRGLRRMHGRGLVRAEAELGSHVVAHNASYVVARRCKRVSAQSTCAA